MRRQSLRNLMAASVSLALAVSVATPKHAAAVTCTDVHVVWATGANGTQGGFDFQQFVNGDLQHRINAPVTLSAFELIAGFGGFTYQPADSAALFGQGMGIGSAYQDSVAGGRDALVAYLQSRSTNCPSEVYVLGGWSEGADVIGSALPLLSATLRGRIAFVAMFGDPKLDTGNDPGFLSPPPIFPPGCFSGQKPWIRGDSPCYASGGIFGSRVPYVPTDIQQRVGSWCRHTDAACEGSWLDIPACCVLNPPFTHGKYFDADSESAQAAREAAARLATYIPAHSSSFDATFDEFVDGQVGADLAVVFDTTGSMSSSIADAKTQATSLAQQWTSLYTNGRVALVEYKDQGDPFVARVDLGLTNSAAEFQGAVDQLSAVGGGDTPEAELSGIMTALDGLDWANLATKAVVVITDAEGKDPEPVTNYTRAAVDHHALEIDPVAIYGVNVSSLQTVSDWMNPMAVETAGKVVTLQPGQSLSDALSDLFDSVHASPVAKLVGPIMAQPNAAVTLDAGGSFDAAASITSYAWDFDGNGTADQTTSTATTSHTYTTAFHGFATVRVLATDGRSALASTTVSIDATGLGNSLPIPPSVAAAAVTGSSQVTVSWTPASGDRADAYKIYLADGTAAKFVAASDPHSAVLNGVNLSNPTSFRVTSWNAFGESIGVATGTVGGSNWSAAVRVNDDSTTTAQVSPDVALGPNGAAIGIWQDYRTTPDIDIYASRWDPGTQAWAPNVRVNDVVTGQQYKPAIAVDGSNNAYAVWVDWRSGRGDVYFSKRSASTGAWSTNVRVNSTTNFTSQDYPAIAVTSTGDAIAMWYRSANNKLNIWSARLPAGSNTWGPEIRVTSNQTTQKQAPRVAFAPNGVAHAVWMDPATGNADIWYASLPAGSSTWSANIKVSDDPGTAFQSSPDVAADGGGNVEVTWTDRRVTPYQLRVRRLPSGGTWATSTVVAADGGGAPSLAARADGRLFLAWYDGDPVNGYPKLWGSIYDPATGSWSAPERIDANPSNLGATNPAVAIGTTRTMVLWKNALNTQSGANDDNIFSRWRTP